MNAIEKIALSLLLLAVVLLWGCKDKTSPPTASDAQKAEHARKSPVKEQSDSSPTLELNLRYSGRPIREFTSAEPVFSLNNRDTHEKGIRPRSESHEGRYVIQELAPGNYVLFVSINANPDNPGRYPGYPGDFFYQDSRLSIGADGRKRLDIDLQQVIHMNLPLDNAGIMEKVGRRGKGMIAFATPVEFAWDALADGARYEYSIYRMQSEPYKYLERDVIKETTQSTRVSLDLAPSAENEFYSFRLRAKKGPYRIGDIVLHSQRGYGADFRFRIEGIRIRAGAEDPILRKLPLSPADVQAVGHASRIDLRWRFDTDSNLAGYNIYRAASEEGPFKKLNESVHKVGVYSDFFGGNDRTYTYYVTSVTQAGKESEPSNIASATSYAMTDEQLLTSVQEAVFRYFWDYGHPVSGLARESYQFRHSTDTCTSGGTGMGLMAICIGVERGFVSRTEAAERILKILAFLDEKASRYHGAWSHWINGATGQTKPFSKYDDGGDIVETAYVVQGLLTVRQYFDDQNDPVETEIRRRATRLWEQVEWEWYLQNPQSQVLYWHWSPNHGWRMNHKIRGYNECMITYLLAIASPTHPIPASCYYKGWANSKRYANGQTYYGYRQWVGPEKGGPLFFTHYSHLGFDPCNKSDRFCNYFDNSRNISLIHRAYCIENPRGFTGYSDLVWGLTASFNPRGYSAHSPTNDNGTMTPSAALSAMPYVPEESMATLKEFYHTYGVNLWGPFGFVDAFNLTQNWFAPGYIAIDQGPIIIMIENYRTQLCWNLFMANPEIRPMLDAIGWTSP